MKRVLSLDYGRKLIGVALSDPLWLGGKVLAPLQVDADNLEKVVQRIISLAHKNKVGEIILGNPLHENYSPSKISQEVASFKENLESEWKKKVILVDEFGTSSEAEAQLEQEGVHFKSKGYKKKVQGCSALIILKDFLFQQERKK